MSSYDDIAIHDQSVDASIDQSPDQSIDNSPRLTLINPVPIHQQIVMTPIKNQSINQLASPSTDQPTNRPIQSIHLARPPMHPSTPQRSINQSASRSINRSINHSPPSSASDSIIPPNFHLSPHHWANHAEDSNQSTNRSIHPSTNQSINSPLTPMSQSYVAFHHIQSMEDTFTDLSSEATSINHSPNQSINQSELKFQKPINLSDFEVSRRTSYSTTINIDQSINQSDNPTPISLLWPHHTEHGELVFGGRASFNQPINQPANKSNNSSLTPSTNPSINPDLIYICMCRSCGQEHYSSAMYHCVATDQSTNPSTNCNYAICLPCTINHLTTQRINQSIDQQERRRVRALAKARAELEEAKYQSMIDPSNDQPINQSSMEPGAIEPIKVNLTSNQPVNASNQSISQSIDVTLNRYWIDAINQLADQVGIPLVLLDEYHQHPLIYFPVTPINQPNIQPINQPINQPIHHKHGRMHSHSFSTESSDQSINQPTSSLTLPHWYCSVNNSNHCVTHQSINQSITKSVNPITGPSYVCLSCHYRVCFSCVRHSFTHSILVQSKLNPSINQSINQPNDESIDQSMEQSRNDVSRLIYQTNDIEARSKLLWETSNQSDIQSINQSIFQSTNQSKSTFYLLLFSVFFAVVLTHGLLSNQPINQSIGLMNTVILLIFAALTAIVSISADQSITKINQSVNQSIGELSSLLHAPEWRSINQSINQSNDHHVHIESGEGNPEGTPERHRRLVDRLIDWSIDLSYLSPRERHVILSLYINQSIIQKHQSRLPWLVLLSLSMYIVSATLICTAITYLLSTVWCDGPINQSINQSAIGMCNERIGISVGIGLFSVLVISPIATLFKFGAAFIERYIHY